MVIKTETVNIDVTLPDGGELPVERSFVVFQLTENDVDVADNQVIPSRPIEVELDQDGIAAAQLWPNDRGERGTLYRVSVVVKDERGIANKDKTYRYGLARFEEGGGPYSLAAEVFDGITPDAVGTITLRARVLLPDGTAALPALGFVGQANTGFSRPATSVLAMSVNGTERARFTTSGMQLNGLMTGTAVTQSSTDATAGRLLKVRDFGLGAENPPNANDLNAIGRAGFSSFASGVQNSPYIFGSLLTVPRGDGRIAQIAFELTGPAAPAAPKIAVRTSSGVSGAFDFSPWAKLYHDLNTTVDANGFIKEASPIVRLFSDRVEEPSQPVGATFERLGAGHYALSGCPPLAAKGWQVAPAGDGEGGVAATVDAPVWVGDTLHVFTRVAGAQADIPSGAFALLRFWSSDVDEDGSQISDPPEPDRIDETEFSALMLSRSKDAIKARRNQAINSGMTVSGVPVYTDDQSQSRIMGAALAATIDPDTTVRWKTSNGDFVMLEAPTIIAIAQAIRAHVQACFDREAELLTALEAGDPYDIGAGWPDGA